MRILQMGKLRLTERSSDLPTVALYLRSDFNSLLPSVNSSTLSTLPNIYTTLKFAKTLHILLSHLSLTATLGSRCFTNEVVNEW